MHEEFDRELAALAPFLEALKRFQGLDFAAGMPIEGWKELARTLREAAGEDRARAPRIVDEFLRTPRYDDHGELVTKIPTPIELRMFARGVSSVPIPEGALPAACDECEPYSGLHRIVSRNGCEGAERCVCARGQALRARDAARVGGAAEKRASRNELMRAADFAKRAAGDVE